MQRITSIPGLAAQAKVARERGDAAAAAMLDRIEKSAIDLHNAALDYSDGVVAGRPSLRTLERMEKATQSLRRSGRVDRALKAT